MKKNQQNFANFGEEPEAAVNVDAVGDLVRGSFGRGSSTDVRWLQYTQQGCPPLGGARQNDVLLIPLSQE